MRAGLIIVSWSAGSFYRYDWSDVSARSESRLAFVNTVGFRDTAESMLGAALAIGATCVTVSGTAEM